jgi:hypothetical protein
MASLPKQHIAAEAGDGTTFEADVNVAVDASGRFFGDEKRLLTAINHGRMLEFGSAK